MWVFIERLCLANFLKIMSVFSGGPGKTTFILCSLERVLFSTTHIAAHPHGFIFGTVVWIHYLSIGLCPRRLAISQPRSTFCYQSKVWAHLRETHTAPSLFLSGQGFPVPERGADRETRPSLSPTSSVTTFPFGGCPFPEPPCLRLPAFVLGGPQSELPSCANNFALRTLFLWTAHLFFLPLFIFLGSEVEGVSLPACLAFRKNIS